MLWFLGLLFILLVITAGAAGYGYNKLDLHFGDVKREVSPSAEVQPTWPTRRGTSRSESRARPVRLQRQVSAEPLKYVTGST